MIDLNPVISRTEHFRDEALFGLLKARKSVPPKFLYDRRGSALFEKICELPSYYLTRAETAALRQRIPEIVELFGNHATLVEFGSGASLKTRLLLDQLADPCAYVPIDISREFLLESSRVLAHAYRGLPVIPVWADYTRALPRLSQLLADRGRRTAFFPGSTIGNLEPAEARSFLADCASFLGVGGRMLIGYDLVKPVKILEDAYNDPEGVTAEFDLNLLDRMNRELGATFVRERFRHHAFFNREQSRMEMHLVSTQAQQVEVAGRRIEFGDEESIHTESSYKHTPERFQQLVGEAKFDVIQTWTDERGFFAVSMLEARAAAAEVKQAS